MPHLSDKDFCLVYFSFLSTVMSLVLLKKWKCNEYFCIRLKEWCNSWFCSSLPACRLVCYILKSPSVTSGNPKEPEPASTFTTPTSLSVILIHLLSFLDIVSIVISANNPNKNIPIFVWSLVLMSLSLIFISFNVFCYILLPFLCLFCWVFL